MREKGGIDIIHLFPSTWEAELEFKASKTLKGSFRNLFMMRNPLVLVVSIRQTWNTFGGDAK